MARSIRFRSWPFRAGAGWLAAASIGFAAGTATAWVVGPGSTPAPEPVQRLEFPHRRIAEGEWLRTAPPPLRLEAMFRGGDRR